MRISFPSALPQAKTDERMQAELQKLKKATQGVEAMFLKDLLSAMRKGMPDSLSKMPGGEIYRDMFDQAVADSLSSKGTLGIGKVLYDQLSKQVIRSHEAHGKEGQ